MRWILCATALAVLSGCQAFYHDVDGRLAERASQPIDEQPIIAEPQALPVKDLPRTLPARVLGAPRAESAVLVAAQKEKPAGNTMLDRLQPPENLLGFKVPDIKLWSANATPKEKEEAIKKQFPPLPAMPKLPPAAPGPDGQLLTLSELQQIALRTNPLIRQAHLDVEAARGLALQAGLYPNPNIGYEGSDIGQNRTPGMQGGFFEQTIVTMGKLSLAREAARREVQIAEQKLRQAEADVQAQVRSSYFAVLSAQKSFETTRALTQLTDELYNVLLLQLLAGEVAAYEPMQIRVLAGQSRNALTLAHSRYVAAWRQLAAALGVPAMPLTMLAGRIDMPAPHFEHDAVLEQVLGNHTDVISAHLGVEKAQLQARLAEVQPYPDLTVHASFQKDFTTTPNGRVTSVSVGVPFPLWHRNQGNIQTMRAQFSRAMDDSERVRNELTSKVAAAFERYDNNRIVLKMYKEQILPNQVQAFRAAVARHAGFGKESVSYNDLVTSQQTLAGLIGSYLVALNDQWSAVTDIAHLLQTRDLFQVQPLDEVAPVPDVCEILGGRFLRRGR